MENDLTKQSSWYLVTIEDSNDLPGESILKVLQQLLKVIKFKYIILNDIEGAGKDWLITTLQEKENTIMKIEEVLNMLCDVTQFDWGDFFLFKNHPENWERYQDMIYPEKIIGTDTTVRAVDDQYVYIYTPHKEIVDIIKENYEIESLKIDTLENLDYPQ